MKLKRIISVAAAAVLAVSAFAGCGSSSSNGSASGSAGTSAETASTGDDGYYHLKGCAFLPFFLDDFPKKHSTGRIKAAGGFVQK